MKGLLGGLGREARDVPPAFRMSAAARSPGDGSRELQWPGMPPEWTVHGVTGNPRQRHSSGRGFSPLRPPKAHKNPSTHG